MWFTDTWIFYTSVNVCTQAQIFFLQVLTSGFTHFIYLSMLSHHGRQTSNIKWLHVVAQRFLSHNRSTRRSLSHTNALEQNQYIFKSPSTFFTLCSTKYFHLPSVLMTLLQSEGSVGGVWASDVNESHFLSQLLRASASDLPWRWNFISLKLISAGRLHTHSYKVTHSVTRLLNLVVFMVFVCLHCDGFWRTRLQKKS